MQEIVCNIGGWFFTTDPDGEPLNECEWATDPATGETRLVHARMQLDSKQWIGIKPRAKTFSAQIDIKGQEGWETMSLDDLRKKAAESWRVPYSEVKYFYSDENMVHKGEGKYDIILTKDGLYSLNEGTFDKTLFVSFMFQVNWARLDLIPVVELFDADQLPRLAQFVVDRKPQLMGEVQVQIKTFHIVPIAFEQSGKRPQLNGGVNMKAKRHVYECGSKWHAQILTIT